MEAKRDGGQDARALKIAWLGGGFAAWALFVVCAGALLLLSQIHQAKYEFLGHADSVFRATDRVLQSNLHTLEALAAFIEVAGSPRPSALHDFIRQLLQDSPQVRRAALLVRQGDDALRSSDVIWRYESPDSPVGLRPVSPAELAVLHDAISLSSRWRRPVVSRMIERPGGDHGYYLVRPLRKEVGLALALEIAADTLLPAAEELPGGLSVVLAGAEGVGAVQRTAADATSRSGLLPMLRTELIAGDGAQPLVLTVSRYLGWDVVQPHVAAAFVTASLLGLLMVIRHIGRRSLREQERRAAERRLYHLANYDSLTGLPNRNLFNDRLQQSLARAQRYNRGVALCFVDLDGFKAVNDTAGHGTGDRLLQMVSTRLTGSVRAHDTVARLSGDEFVVVLEDVRGRPDAERVLSQLRDGFIEPFIIDDYQFMLTASIGLAVYPEDGTDPAQLLQRADARMYAVKYPEWMAETAPTQVPV